jgi:hypothetical protein
MGCCSSTATAPSEPLPSQPAPQGTALVSFPPQTSPEMSPDPSSRPQSQTRSRIRSMPELKRHSRMPSQDSKPRTSITSTPQPPQSSRSSSSQNHQTRDESIASFRRINRFPASLSRAIRASIEYVVCLPTLISFICLVLRNGRSRKYIDLTDNPIPTTCFPLGYWRNLWSNLDFADKPVKHCVNVIHIDIVKIWDLDDRNGVSSFSCPCFNCSTESVSLR